jgi:hypothetical protein
VHGISSWNQPNFFYPYKDTLGYNDGYFLFGLIHVLFRYVGVDVFLSAEIVNIIIRITGFVSFYLLARGIGGIRYGWCVVGAVIFTIANNTYTQSYHVQLLSVAFSATFALLIRRGWVACERARHHAASGWLAGAAALLSALFMTSFYIAWFTTFYMVIFLLVTAVAQRHWASRIPTLRWRASQPFLIAAAVFVVTIMPFLVVYLPKLRETRGHEFAEAFIYSPSLLDISNIGSGNLLFGWLNDWLNGTLRPGFPLSGEHMMGLPFGLLASFLLAVGWLWRHRIDPRHAAMRSVAVATLLAWALALHVRSHTPWELIYNLVPGAKGIRVVARLQILLVIPVVLVTIHVCSHAVWPRRRSAAFALACLLVFEEINTTGVVGLMRKPELARVAQIGEPPPECRVFYASRGRGGPAAADDATERVYSHNVDAMFIAGLVAVPTINGMASFVPPDWNLVDPDGPEYRDRITAYATRHDIHNLCALDLHEMTWR